MRGWSCWMPRGCGGWWRCSSARWVPGGGGCGQGRGLLGSGAQRAPPPARLTTPPTHTHTALQYNTNMELRMKYADQPERFLESEVRGVGVSGMGDLMARAW